METKKYTQVRVTVEGRERLRVLAEANRRSMTQQLEWLIDQAWERFVRMQRPEALAARGEGGSRELRVANGEKR